MDFSKFTYAKGEPKQDAEDAVPGENLPLHESEEGGEEAKPATEVNVSPDYRNPAKRVACFAGFVSFRAKSGSSALPDAREMAVCPPGKAVGNRRSDLSFVRHRQSFLAVRC